MDAIEWISFGRLSGLLSGITPRGLVGATFFFFNNRGIGRGLCGIVDFYPTDLWITLWFPITLYGRLPAIGRE
jgi:hypothetical protein